MELNPNRLNITGKLKHLLADDLFAKEIKQVFNAKTGAYMGYIIDGKEIITEQQPEEQLPEENKNDPNQLSLF